MIPRMIEEVVYQRLISLHKAIILLGARQAYEGWLGERRDSSRFVYFGFSPILNLLIDFSGQTTPLMCYILSIK